MDVLEKLKRVECWNRSAFVAQCAQIVLPLFDKAWPDAIADRKDAVARTIELTLIGAKGRLIPSELSSACLECRIVAGKALRPLHPKGPFGDLKEPAPRDPESCNLAHYVASAAAWAADSLTSDEEQSPHNATYAFGFALDAAALGLHAEISRSLQALVAEFERDDL
jgi:hypothetical protein